MADATRHRPAIWAGIVSESETDPAQTNPAQIGRVASSDGGTAHFQRNAAVAIADQGRVAPCDHP